MRLLGLAAACLGLLVVRVLARAWRARAQRPASTVYDRALAAKRRWPETAGARHARHDIAFAQPTERFGPIAQDLALWAALGIVLVLLVQAMRLLPFGA